MPPFTKVYIYWGPAPALILAAIKLFYSEPIADQYVTFGFLTGLLVFLILIILKIWNGFYRDVPPWMVIIGILATGLVCPIPWMLGTAAIYEATILGGQFFLIAGLYFAVSAIEAQSSSNSRLLIAVAFWTFAACTRTILLIPAAFLTVVLCLWTIRNGWKSILKVIPRFLLLGSPLVLGIFLYGWYNYSRFGSIFETGLRYTLTFQNLNKDIGESFSFLHLLPSLWTYLVNPIDLQTTFPFILAQPGQPPSYLTLGDIFIYHSEDITGLLFCVPFLLLSIISAKHAITILFDKLSPRRRSSIQPGDEAFMWISICLAGAGFLIFSALLLYFNIAMRFLADFIPSLMLFSVLGVFHAYHTLKNRSGLLYSFQFIFILLAVVTIGMSIFLALSQNYHQFQIYNLHLLKHMIQFFDR